MAHEQQDVAGKRGWQDIASAPKNGTVIDLWDADVGRLADCRWGHPEHSCGEAGQYCDSDWHGERESWVDITFNARLSDCDLTHWMPLPEAPE